MDRNENVEALVLDARSGNAGAKELLYRRFAGVVHGVLLGYVQSADADDLTQDVFETALRRLDDLREPAAFPGWLLSIARRAALQRLRRPSSRELNPESLIHPSPTPDVELEAQRMLAAIRNLPPAYRETLMLRLVEGLTGPEISARTGLTPGSVRVNLHRGMHMLRSKFRLNASEEAKA